MEGSGDSRTFTVKLRNFKSGQMEDVRFEMYRERERLRVTAPKDMKSFEKKF